MTSEATLKPVLGWRVWGYPFEHAAKDGIIRLGRNGEVFPFEGPAIAGCNPKDDDYREWDNGKAPYEREHVSPDPRCTCGIFAYHNSNLRHRHNRMGYEAYWAFYLVKCWGRLGYGKDCQMRAQYVEPVAISFRYELSTPKAIEAAQKISENYDIPIIRHYQVSLFAELKGLSFDKPSSR